MDPERKARAEALRWVAAQLETEIEEARQDWVRMLLREGHRARINALSETAAMCRSAASRVERGKPLTGVDE